jgi:16S rRNA (uracil1498-N3)-methyltransferase
MAHPRFYCPYPLAAFRLIELPPELAHHAIRVLRLKAGTSIVLFDGLGGQYPATLAIEGKKGLAQTGAHQDTETELAGDITLVQGIPASDKMDWIIEKAVELGVTKLVPIAAQRSVLQLAGERLGKRRRHWDRIAQSASEQCGRNRLMAIDAPASLHDYLKQTDLQASHALFCHPEAPRPLHQALPAGAARIHLFVGPEGGWSDEEQALVERYKLTPVKFGRRILRTETAGLALIAAVSALQGWH